MYNQYHQQQHPNAFSSQAAYGSVQEASTSKSNGPNSFYQQPAVTITGQQYIQQIPVNSTDSWSLLSGFDPSFSTYTPPPATVSNYSTTFAFQPPLADDFTTKTTQYWNPVSYQAAHHSQVQPALSLGSSSVSGTTTTAGGGPTAYLNTQTLSSANEREYNQMIKEFMEQNRSCSSISEAQFGTLSKSIWSSRRASEPVTYSPLSLSL